MMSEGATSIQLGYFGAALRNKDLQESRTPGIGACNIQTSQSPVLSENFDAGESVKIAFLEAPAYPSLEGVIRFLGKLKRRGRSSVNPLKVQLKLMG